MSHDRIDTLITRMRTAGMCAVSVTTLVTVQENVRLAQRMLSAADLDVTAASIARNAIEAACAALEAA